MALLKKNLLKKRKIGIRNDYRCLVVGVEKGNGHLMSPEADMVLEKRDVVWVVGEKENIYKLVNSEVYVQ